MTATSSETMRHANRQSLWTRTAPQGSALVLVLLLMLALSAIGMLALQNITSSIEQSGVYRVRTTSGAFGDGAANFWARRSAGNAGDVWRSMRQGDGCRDAMAGNTSMTQREWRELRSEIGGCARYDGSKNSFGQMLQTNADHESGLFTDDSKANHLSFESKKKNSTFEVIAQYPYEANPPSGFSEDDYCFKMVTVAAEGQLGELSDTWDQLEQVGRGRAVFKGKIGPVACESQ